MYIFDTNVFYTLGSYYPSRFPTIWNKISELVTSGDLQSVREVRREIETNCPFPHIAEWTEQNRDIFKIPSDEEMKVVSEIFRTEQYQGLVKRSNILKGLPAADPFVIAAGKVHRGYVVTQEAFRGKGARIPTVCEDFGVKCINLEQFLAHEELRY
jgi:hypothetical protein